MSDYFDKRLDRVFGLSVLALPPLTSLVTEPFGPREPPMPRLAASASKPAIPERRQAIATRARAPAERAARNTATDSVPETGTSSAPDDAAGTAAFDAGGEDTPGDGDPEPGLAPQERPSRSSRAAKTGVAFAEPAATTREQNWATATSPSVPAEPHRGFQAASRPATDASDQPPYVERTQPGQSPRDIPAASGDPMPANAEPMSRHIAPASTSLARNEAVDATMVAQRRAIDPGGVASTRPTHEVARGMTDAPPATAETPARQPASSQTQPSRSSGAPAHETENADDRVSTLQGSPRADAWTAADFAPPAGVTSADRRPPSEPPPESPATTSDPSRDTVRETPGGPETIQLEKATTVTEDAVELMQHGDQPVDRGPVSPRTAHADADEEGLPLALQRRAADPAAAIFQPGLDTTPHQSPAASLPFASPPAAVTEDPVGSTRDGRSVDGEPVLARTAHADADEEGLPLVLQRRAADPAAAIFRPGLDTTPHQSPAASLPFDSPPAAVTEDPVGSTRDGHSVDGEPVSPRTAHANADEEGLPLALQRRAADPAAAIFRPGLDTTPHQSPAASLPFASPPAAVTEDPVGSTRDGRSVDGEPVLARTAHADADEEGLPLALQRRAADPAAAIFRPGLDTTPHQSPAAALPFAPPPAVAINPIPPEIDTFVSGDRASNVANPLPAPAAPHAQTGVPDDRGLEAVPPPRARARRYEGSNPSATFETTLRVPDAADPTIAETQRAADRVVTLQSADARLTKLLHSQDARQSTLQPSIEPQIGEPAQADDLDMSARKNGWAREARTSNPDWHYASAALRPLNQPVTHTYDAQPAADRQGIPAPTRGDDLRPSESAAAFHPDRGTPANPQPRELAFASVTPPHSAAAAIASGAPETDGKARPDRPLDAVNTGGVAQSAFAETSRVRPPAAPPEEAVDQGHVASAPPPPRSRVAPAPVQYGRSETTDRRVKAPPVPLAAQETHLQVRIGSIEIHRAPAPAAIAAAPDARPRALSLADYLGAKGKTR